MLAFIKVGQTWFNMLTITRVQVIEDRSPPSTRLAVTLTDRQQPVDVAEPDQVTKVLAFCERHAYSDVPPVPPVPPALAEQKAAQPKQEKPKQQETKQAA